MQIYGYFLKQVNERCENAWWEWQQDTELSRHDRQILKHFYWKKYGKPYFYSRIFLVIWFFLAPVLVIHVFFPIFEYSREFLKEFMKFPDIIIKLLYVLLSGWIMGLIACKVDQKAIEKIETANELFRNDLSLLKPDKTGQFSFLKPKCSEAFLPELMKQGLNAGFGKKEMKKFIQNYELFLKLNEEKAGYCSLGRFCRENNEKRHDLSCKNRVK